MIQNVVRSPQSNSVLNLVALWVGCNRKFIDGNNATVT